MDVAMLTSGDLPVRFAVDLVAVAILAYGIFFRRHSERQLFVVLCMFNVGLLVALQVIATGSIGLGVGFGLFAILSIIRLRSEPFGFSEMGYFFAALVLALVCGIDVGGWETSAVLSAVVLATAAVVDSPRLVRPMCRTEVTLELVFTDEPALVRHLEERLSTSVCRVDVREIDFVRETTRAVVRHRPQKALPPTSEERLDDIVAGRGG